METDKIIQIQHVRSDQGTDFTYILGLSESGRLYKLSDEATEWVLVEDSPERNAI